MKVPFSWLKDYVDIDVSAQELQAKLFSCGFEVEELVYLGTKINNVVVGEITHIEKHPDSDHMVVCSLNCGAYGENIQIVTGASNVNEGDKVPVALDGSTVCESNPALIEKNGEIKKIKKGKLRGVESFGMLCSGEELGINDDYYEGAEVYGILILDKATPVGEDIKKVVGLDDYIFDINVTANRPDCQCVLGIAREVAAVLKKPVKTPDFSYTEVDVNDGVDVNVTVKDSELCPRYVGHYVTDIKIGKSPAWIRKRLALCGIRSISNIVDITNFVLLELGQPMHSFDLDSLEGREIVVRRAEKGEVIQTLDEKKFELNTDNLVICDGNKPVALAGVMGGLNSEITENTKNVYFEAAKFARDNVRHTARALGQSTDSSSRFEKGVDAYTTYYGMARALHLVEELNCGTVTSNKRDRLYTDVSGKKMSVKISKINALLGIIVPNEAVKEILESLNFKVEIAENGDDMEVEVPAYREDVDGYPDLAEEIIREYGYDNIKPTFLNAATITNGGLTDEQKQMNKFKSAARTQGFMEAITYSFYSAKDFDMIHLPVDAPERNAVKILNPLGEDLSLMRTTLVPTMLSNVVRNVRRGNESGRLFEVGNVYIPSENPTEELPEERTTVSFAIWGDGDFFDLKGAIFAIASEFQIKLSVERVSLPFLHPGISAKVMMGNKEIGFVGELDPTVASEQALEKKVYLAQIDYKALSKKFEDGTKYVPVSKFPEVKRDLALIADEEVTCGAIEECIKRASKAVSDVKLFDIFRGAQIGENKKSMAFTLTFKCEPTAEKALTGDQVDNFVKKILNNLKFNLGIEIRG